MCTVCMLQKKQHQLGLLLAQVPLGEHGFVHDKAFPCSANLPSQSVHPLGPRPVPCQLLSPLRIVCADYADVLPAQHRGGGGGNAGEEEGYHPKDPPMNSARTTVANGGSMRNCWVRTHAVHLVRYRTNCITLLVAKRCESPYCIPGPTSRCTLRLAKCLDYGQAICLAVTLPPFSPFSPFSPFFDARRVMALYGRS